MTRHAVGVILCAALTLISSGGSTQGPLTVAAAVSLTNALEEIAVAYGKAGGGAVRFNLAGSNVLARQILNGAPADVFISADEAQMDLVERGGRLVAGSRVVLVENQLAIVTTPERAEMVRRDFATAPPTIRRLALGDPSAVPAGVYARRYLEQRGLWSAYEARIVPTTNVRAALTAVETGSVDAAIVYVTDLAAARSAALAFAVPVGEAPRIVYPAALVAGTQLMSEATRFLTFLRGPDAGAIFVRHKFSLPHPG